MGSWPKQYDQCPAAIMATLFTFQVFARSALYGWEPLSSAQHTSLRSKDDGYIGFNMYTARWVPRAGLKAS
jgi:hypothetical protein